jgi:V8-like Glu-specific endopeptidase
MSQRPIGRIGTFSWGHMTRDDSSLIRDTRTLIAEGDISLALDRLKVASHGGARSFYDTVLLLESRFNRLSRNRFKGLLTQEQADVAINKLSDDVLEFVATVSAQLDRGAQEVVKDVAPPPAIQELVHQKILGINNLKQISWIEVGLRSASSVCRVLTPTGMGTGFLVGDGLVMTNNHVIATAGAAAQSQVEFNYQQDAQGGFLQAVRYGLDAAGFHTNIALDYSIIKLRPEPTKPPPISWGCLRLSSTADPLPSEHVTVIQHPNGGYKQIVLTSNWVIGTQAPALHYTTDTMPGSSGSPVFNDSWHVIAIHHAGGTMYKDSHGAVRYTNEGILMSAIREAAGPHWPQP